MIVQVGELLFMEKKVLIQGQSDSLNQNWNWLIVVALNIRMNGLLFGLHTSFLNTSYHMVFIL